MTEPADHQPDDPAYCTYETTRHGTRYRCVSEAHKSGGHDLKGPDELPDPLRNYLATTLVGDLEDRTDLIPTDPPSADEATLAKRFQRDVQFLERKHFAELYAYEVGAGHALMEDLYALDESRWAENLTADEASLRRIKARVDAWLLQVGVRDDEDGGA